MPRIGQITMSWIFEPISKSWSRNKYCAVPIRRWRPAERIAVPLHFWEWVWRSGLRTLSTLPLLPDLDEVEPEEAYSVRASDNSLNFLELLHLWRHVDVLWCTLADVDLFFCFKFSMSFPDRLQMREFATFNILVIALVPSYQSSFSGSCTMIGS